MLDLQYKRLSEADREAISRGLAAGMSYAMSYASIARSIGRARSTVCREVARNHGKRRYRAMAASGERRGGRAGNSEVPIQIAPPALSAGKPLKGRRRRCIIRV